MSKSYIDMIQTQWENILNLYLQFEENRPVMLYEIGKQQISAYPYEDFIIELDKKAQQSLHQQYQRAFVARLDEINALADEAPGFVWRLQDESPLPVFKFLTTPLNRQYVGLGID